MKFNIAKVLLLLFLVCSSCVPHKDLIYLQENEENQAIVNGQIHLNQKPYKVQISDLLSINIKALDAELVAMFNPKNADKDNQGGGDQNLYYNGFTVDTHGNIKIPIIGEMNVLGYTTEEISEQIKEKLLKDYFNEAANIFVVVKLAGFRFTVNGEVNEKGSIVLFQDRVNIMEAIANAGDITIVGDRKDVMIIRQYPQGQKIHHIDLTSVDAMNSPYYYIQPHDYIYVKPLKQKTLGTGTTFVQSLTTVVTVLSLVTSALLLSKNL